MSDQPLNNPQEKLVAFAENILRFIRDADSSEDVCHESVTDAAVRCGLAIKKPVPDERRYLVELTGEKTPSAIYYFGSPEALRRAVLGEDA